MKQIPTITLEIELSERAYSLMQATLDTVRIDSSDLIETALLGLISSLSEDATRESLVRAISEEI